MGAPFDAKKDEMTTAPLMVTVRNAGGAAHARHRCRERPGRDPAARRRRRPRVAVDRRPAINNSEDCSRRLHGQDAAGARLRRRGPGRAAVRREHSRGRHRARTLPTGLEFARYSIDYHYIRNQLFCDDRMGTRATRHVPSYARAICEPYADDVEKLKNPPPPALAALVPCVRGTGGELGDDATVLC